LTEPFNPNKNQRNNMKKLVAIAVGLGLAASAWAQGTVTFKNYGYSPRFPITETDGTTLLAGSAYLVDLYYGAVGAAPSSFTSLGLAIPFNTAAGAGYFNGNDVVIPSFAGGSSVQVQARAWRASDGATWLAASATGHASPVTAPAVTVTLGGQGSPPALAGTLQGLLGHSLTVVPEPSTILLGMAGIAGLLFLRRKVS
jgi:hypothetical protein